MDWGRLFFSAYGRIRRQDFWMTFLILFGAGLLVGWFFPIGIVLLYCSICTRSKRLHDMGRTGWLQLIPWVAYAVALVFTLYFVIGAIVAGHGVDDYGALAISGIVFGGLTVFFAWMTAFLIDLGFLLWIGVTEGEPDDNRFGPPPVIPEASHIARA